MPEQVIIEFLSSTEGLQPAVSTLAELGVIGKESLDKITKNNEILNASLKKSTGGVEDLSDSFQNLDKNIPGNENIEKFKKFTHEIDDSVTKSKSLKAQLIALKQELSLMEQSGQQGSKAFQDLAVKAGKLEDQIGDTAQRVRILASDTKNLQAALSVATGLAGAFAVAQGAAGLLGKSNEELQKTLVKVQSALAILNGLQAIQATLNKDSAASVVLLSAAQKAYNIVVGTSTGAMKAFRIALASTGIGLLILAVGYLVSQMTSLGGSVSDATKDLREHDEEMEKLKLQYEKITGRITELEFELGNLAIENKKALQLVEDDTQEKLAAATGFWTKFTDGVLDLLFRRTVGWHNLSRVEKIEKESQDKIAKINEEGNQKVANINAEASKRAVEAAKKAADDLAKELERQRLLRIKQDDLLNLAVTEAEIEAWKHRNDALKALYDTDVDNASAAIDKKLAAQTAALGKGLEDEKNAAAEKLATQIALTNQLKSLGDSLFQFTLNLDQQEIASLEEKHRRGIISDKTFNKQVAEARHKQAVAEKEKAAFDIVIGTAVAVLQALANTAPPYSYVLAAISAATGAVELASVLSHTIPSVPQFATGTKKAPPGMKLVGEKGPELIPDSDKGGYPIIPNKETREILAKWDMPSLDIYPATPYISDATLDSIERGRMNHTAIDYDILADKLSEKLGAIVAKHPRLNVSIDEKGFEKRLIEGMNRRKSLDDYYSWKG